MLFVVAALVMAVAATAMAAAGMTLAMIVMTAAGMTFAMMIAADIGVECQRSADQSIDSIIGIARYTAEEADTSLCKSHLCTAANTAADECIYTAFSQKTGQSTVTTAVGIDDLSSENFTVLDLIDLELLRMTKMLENLSVCVGNCNFHGISSLGSMDMGVEFILAAFNAQTQTVDQHMSQLPTGGIIDQLYCGSGDLHLSSALFL